jgi:hypothetical protein
MLANPVKKCSYNVLKQKEKKKINNDGPVLRETLKLFEIDRRPMVM